MTGTGTGTPVRRTHAAATRHDGGVPPLRRRPVRSVRGRLLETGELPGLGWAQVGARGRSERSFVDATGRGLLLQLRALPDAPAAAEALAAVAAVGEEGTGSDVADGTGVAGRRVVPAPVVPAADDRWAGEVLTDGPDGAGAELTLAATDGPLLVLARASGSRAAWTWSQVAEVVATQLSRATR